MSQTVRRLSSRGAAAGSEASTRRGMRAPGATLDRMQPLAVATCHSETPAYGRSLGFLSGLGLSLSSGYFFFSYKQVFQFLMSEVVGSQSLRTQSNL